MNYGVLSLVMNGQSLFDTFNLEAAVLQRLSTCLSIDSSQSIVSPSRVTDFWVLIL